MNARFVTSAVLLTLLALAPALEIEGLPKPGEPREAKVLVPDEKTLANGLRVIVVERPGLPLVSAEVLLQSGSEADPPKAAGLAAFTAELLTQGTTSRSATQIAREIEALGAKLEATADWDGSTVGLLTLSAQVEPAFALLADVTRHPAFAPEEIERQRRQTLDELRLSLEQPGTVAKLAAARVMLGAGRYAQPAKGTPASIKGLRREEIAAFHTARYSPNRATIIIVGNITAEAASALAEKFFGDWTAAEQTTAEENKFTAAEKPRAVLIDMPNAGQAAVYVGVPAIGRSATDYFAGLVGNVALGGGYTSRLNQEIRVKRGLSYGAGSSLSALRDGGTFIAGCQTKNVSAPEVVKLMRTELQRLAGEPLPADFLETRQAVVAGDFARDLETNHGYVEQIGKAVMRGLPLDSLREYLANARKVTAEDIRAFAHEHLPPEAMNVVIAGRAKDFAKPLRALFPKLEIIPLAELDLDSPTLRRPGKH
jgi:zinc protease